MKKKNNKKSEAKKEVKKTGPKLTKKAQKRATKKAVKRENKKNTPVKKKRLPTPKMGLQPPKEDRRDFSYSKVFGSVPAVELPEEFYVSDISEEDIKDQKNLDFCTGFAAASISEDQEGMPLNGHFPFMAAKRSLGGDEWKKWGLSLRDICKTAVNVGFIEEEHFPFAGENRAFNREFVANPANWPIELDELAKSHKKASFFDVDGPYDMFDNIRSTLYLNRLEKASVLAGALWRKNWTFAKDGIITDATGPVQEGHAFKIFGWLPINGEPHLVIQNSWGAQYGNKGLFYFPRHVVNATFTYGLYSFKDMPREKAEVYNEYNISVQDSPWIRFWKVLKALFTRLIKKV